MSLISSAREHSVLRSPVPMQDAEGILSGRFCFLNETRKLRLPPEWDFPAAPSRLWEYNLHYFDWLWTLLAPQSAFSVRPSNLDEGYEVRWNLVRAVVEDWIANHPPRRGAVGWEPYPVSLRIINWTLLLFVIHRDHTLADPVFARALWESIWRQGEWLCGHLETHIQANHLMENLAALSILGSVFSGESANRWLQIAVPRLGKEIAEQILPDGCHYERSPMYHLRMLWLMATLAEVGASEVSELARSRLPAMQDALGFLRHPDGRIALLNDSAHGIYSEPDSRCKPPTGPFALGDAGYYGFRNAQGDYVVIDAGPIGPDHQPGHAHADYFSFELSLGGKRVITDTGVHDYQPGAGRAYARSTRAHNTVEVENVNSCEVWGTFRVGRRVKPVVERWDPRSDGFDLKAEHSGYAHLPGAPVHQRTFQCTPGSLRILDSVISRRNVHAVGRLHLAPGVEVHISGTEATCRLEGQVFRVRNCGHGTLHLTESDYHPEFGRCIRRPALEYRINCETGGWATEITW